VLESPVYYAGTFHVLEFQLNMLEVHIQVHRTPAYYAGPVSVAAK